jgi:hypothetical protein
LNGGRLRELSAVNATKAAADDNEKKELEQKVYLFANKTILMDPQETLDSRFKKEAFCEFVNKC